MARLQSLREANRRVGAQAQTAADLAAPAGGVGVQSAGASATQALPAALSRLSTSGGVSLLRHLQHQAGNGALAGTLPRPAGRPATKPVQRLAPDPKSPPSTAPDAGPAPADAGPAAQGPAPDAGHSDAGPAARGLAPDAGHPTTAAPPSGGPPAGRAAVPPVPPPPSGSPPSAPAPAAEVALDADVAALMEERKDPDRDKALGTVLTQIDTLRLQSLQYSFTPSGLAHMLLQTVLPTDAVEEHARAGFDDNAYEKEGGWQSFAESARAVIRILGDVASAVAAISGIVAIVGLAFAWTGAGALVAGVAADVAVIAGLIKVVTDLLDAIIGACLMASMAKKLHASSEPAARARYATLIKKEAADTSSAAVSFGIGLAITLATAGVGAFLNGEAGSARGWVKAALGGVKPGAPWTATTLREGAAAARMAGKLLPEVLTEAQMAEKFGEGSAFRIMDFLVEESNVVAARDLAIAAFKRNVSVGVRVGVMGIALGNAATAGLTQGKVTAGLDGSPPDAAPGLAVPGRHDTGVAHVAAWPSGLTQISQSRGLIQAARLRMADWQEMAAADASDDARAAVQGVIGTIEAKHTRQTAAAATAQQQSAQASEQLTRADQQGQLAANSGADAKAKQAQMKTQGDAAAARMRQVPTDKPGVWDRIKNKVGGGMKALQDWVQDKLLRLIASHYDLTPDEQKMIGLKDQATKDKEAEAATHSEATAAAAQGDKTAQALKDLKSHASRRDANAMQAMSDTARWVDELDGADDALAAEEDAWKASIAAAAPQLGHQLATRGKRPGTTAAPIDAAMAAPVLQMAAAGGTASKKNADGIAAQLDSAAGTVWDQVKATSGPAAADAAKAQFVAAAPGPVAALQQAAAKAGAACTRISGEATAKVGTTEYDALQGLAQQLETALNACDDAMANSVGDLTAAGAQAIKDHTKPPAPAPGPAAAVAPAPAADGPAAPPPNAPPAR